MAGRVTLEGFESSVPVAPERREAFLKFNCRGETEITEEGICGCWYDWIEKGDKMIGWGFRFLMCVQLLRLDPQPDPQ